MDSAFEFFSFHQHNQKFYMTAKNVLPCYLVTVCQQKEQSCEQLQELIGHPWNNWAGKARGRGIERDQRPHKETDGCYTLFFNV